MRSKLSDHKKAGCISAAVALVFALCMVWGQGLNSYGEIPVRSLTSWLAVVGLFLLTWYILFHMLAGVEKGRFPFLQREAYADIENPKVILLGIDRKDLRNFALFMVCYLPALLAVYPGFFLYDAQDEYVEVATRVFTTHHPLLHVLALGGTVCGVHKFTGSYNLGIFLYMLLQMAVVSACFSYLLHWMKQKGFAKRFRILTFGYLAIFPLNVMFVLCSAKDTLFAAFLLVAMIRFLDWCVYETERTKKEEYTHMIVFSVVMAVALLLRNNALYAFLISAVLYVVIIKDKRKKVLMACVATVLLYFICSKGMALALHAQGEGSKEMLTVPIQQLARSYSADASQFTKEEKSILFTYLPEDALNRYTPKLSDPVKVDFNEDAYAANKVDFWKIWAKTFVHNPIGYVNAWCMTSYGFWYPDADVDVYKGHVVFTHSYENSSYFGFETEEPGVRASKLPFLEKVFEEISLEDTVQNIPVVKLLFSMGALFWFYVGLACMFAIRRAYGRLMVIAFPGLVWMTFLLGPTFLPRYMVFLWFLLPLFLGEALFARGGTDEVRQTM